MNPASDFLAALRRALDAQGIVARADGAGNDPQAGVDRDMTLLEAMLAPDAPPSLMRIWQNSRCLVASASQAGRPGFADAVAALAPEIRVVRRRSGGTAVIHHEGVMNLSLYLAEGGTNLSLDQAYARFGAVLRPATLELGVETDLGPVPDAHCDGRFNLRWRRRKLAGTAGYYRKRSPRGVWLIHASLAMSGPVETDLALIERFEALLGMPRRYAAAAHITLEHAMQGLNRHSIGND